MRRTLLSPLLLALALAAQDARGEMPELWRWTDAEGIPRYTPDPDHVPTAQRGTLTRVEPGGPQAAEPAPEMRPAAIFVPPGEPALEADPFNAPAPPRVETEIVPPVPLETEPRAAATPAPAPAAPAVPAPARSEPPPRPAVAASPARPSAQASEVVPIAAIEPEEVTLDAPTAAPAAPPAPVDSVPPVDAAPPTASAAAEPAVPPVASAPAPEPSAEPGALPPQLEARRAELLAAIARDEETLKAHVSAGDDPLSGSPELREIAARLPALQAELRALEAQRGPR